MFMSSNTKLVLTFVLKYYFLQEQYELCYEIITQYLERFDEYANLDALWNPSTRLWTVSWMISKDFHNVYITPHYYEKINYHHV